MSRKPPKQDEVLAENGLTLHAVAATAAQVFAGVTGLKVNTDGAEWLAVANLTAAMFNGGVNDGSTLTCDAFAEMLRKAYAREVAPNRQLVPFEQLHEKARRAWVGVARHVHNCFNWERQDAAKIDKHVKRMVEYASRGFRN